MGRKAEYRRFSRSSYISCIGILEIASLGMEMLRQTNVAIRDLADECSRMQLYGSQKPSMRYVPKFRVVLWSLNTH